jgi:hypothetical protein
MGPKHFLPRYVNSFGFPINEKSFLAFMLGPPVSLGQLMDKAKPIYI